MGAQSDHGRGIASSAMSAKVSAALPFVLESWLPFNRKAARDLRARIITGAFDSNRDALVRELKRDIPLFLLCLRKLSELVYARRDHVVPHIEPAEIIFSEPTSTIADAIDAALTTCATHSYSEMSDCQREVLTMTVTAASAAQAMAPARQVCEHTAFAASALRQLGLSLVAWNYPHVFERALLQISAGKSIEALLVSVLGFSPRTLSIALARSWHFSPRIRIAMGDDQLPPGMSPKEVATAEALQEICSMSERIARSAHPDMFGESRSDGVSATEAIRTVLGDEGIRRLNSAVHEYVGAYLSQAGTILKAPNILAGEEPQDQPDALTLNAPATENRYLSRCEPRLRAAIESLYHHSAGGSVSRSAIEHFRSGVIPLTGFDRGCIFLLDPETFQLAPRLALAHARLSDYTHVSTSGLRSPLSAKVPYESATQEAFSSSMPSMQPFTGVGAAARLAVAGLLGHGTRAGVLYLETALAGQDASEILVTFKALRHALNHALRFG